MADPTAEEIEVASAIARADQESVEIVPFSLRAAKLAAFWSRLRDAGMSKQLAGVMTITEQNRMNEEEDDD